MGFLGFMTDQPLVFQLALMVRVQNFLASISFHCTPMVNYWEICEACLFFMEMAYFKKFHTLLSGM